MRGTWARLQRLWHRATSSFWFVPGLLVTAAVGLALLLIEAQGWLPPNTLTAWPGLFGAGPEGSRGLLTAVAGSMITVAGVVFSITLVALSLTSSQYSPRVLRNFMRNRGNQAVLGVFVGIFAYCLVVLRTIRGPGDDDPFVPSLAVLGGLLLAIVGTFVLVFFIHHISSSIQASRILATAFEETLACARRSLPDDDPIHAEDEHDGRMPREPGDVVVRAERTGYLDGLDLAGLQRIATEHARVVHVGHELGAFVDAGVPLLTVSGPLPERAMDDLCDAVSISPSRSLDQDVAFGVRQMVDVALKGLSPGINDTTTAEMAVDYLTAVLRFIAPRPIRARQRSDDGELRVVLRVTTFPTLVRLAFDPIRRNAGGNAIVLARLLWAAGVLGHVALAPQRRAAVVDVVRSVRRSIGDTIADPTDRAQLLQQADDVLRDLGTPVAA